MPGDLSTAPDYIPVSTLLIDRSDSRARNHFLEIRTGVGGAAILAKAFLVAAHDSMGSSNPSVVHLLWRHVTIGLSDGKLNLAALLCFLMIVGICLPHIDHSQIATVAYINTCTLPLNFLLLTITQLYGPPKWQRGPNTGTAKGVGH